MGRNIYFTAFIKDYPHINSEPIPIDEELVRRSPEKAVQQILSEFRVSFITKNKKGLKADRYPFKKGAKLSKTSYERRKTEIPINRTSGLKKITSIKVKGMEFINVIVLHKSGRKKLTKATYDNRPKVNRWRSRNGRFVKVVRK